MTERVTSHIAWKPEDRAKLYKYFQNFETDAELLFAERVAHEVLPFIQRGLMTHTAHDINHCVRVIEYTNMIIEIMNSNGAEVSQTEAKLLYLAGWIHDIGNLTGRKDHAVESCRMLRILNQRYGILKEIASSLEPIILYHQSEPDLSELDDEEYRLNNDRIRIRLLSAVFRLADACHMGEDRANSIVYLLVKDEFSPEAKSHWKSNKAIMSVDFNLRNESIEITVSDKRNSQFLIKRFKKEFSSTRPHLGEYFPLNRVTMIAIPNYPVRITNVFELPGRKP